MILYKYLEANWAIKVLEDKRIKVTPPNEFNDVYEFYPAMPKLNYLKMYDKMFGTKERIIVFWEEYRKRTGENVSFDEFEKRIPILSNKEKIRFAKSNIRPLYRFIEDFNNIVSQTSGLLCLSQKPDNVLLWSHYADGHKGLVIGYDASVYKNKLYKVKYSKKRYVLPKKWVYKDDINNKYIDKIITRKSSDWKYEREYRVLFDLENLISENNNNGKTIYFADVFDIGIVEVILGKRMSEEDEGRVVEMLKGNKFQHVKLYRYDINSKLYRIDLKKVN